MGGPATPQACSFCVTSSAVWTASPFLDMSIQFIVLSPAAESVAVVIADSPSRTADSLDETLPFRLRRHRDTDPFC